MPKNADKRYIKVQADTQLLYPPASTVLREVINSIDSLRALKPAWKLDTTHKKAKTVMKASGKTRMKAMKAMKVMQDKKAKTAMKATKAMQVMKAMKAMQGKRKT